MLCETQTETFFCKTKKGKSSRIKNACLSTLALSSLALSLSSLSLSLSVTSLNLYHFLFPGATNGVQCSLEASTPSALLPPPLPLPPLPPAPPAPPRSAAAASRRCSSMTRGVTLMMCHRLPLRLDDLPGHPDGNNDTVGVAFAKFTGLLVPWFSEKHILATVLGLKVSAAQVLAIVSIVVLTGLNMRGLRTGKTIQGLFTVTKTVALSGLILLGFFVGANAAAIKANWAVFWKASWTHMASGQIVSVEPLAGLIFVLAAIGAAMVGSLFASDEWYTVTYIAGEVKNPKRNIR